MKIPGEILKKYVRFGVPQLSGKYVCWIKPKEKNATSIIEISDIKVKDFNKGSWFNPEHIIAWLGPLPVYSIDELIENNDPSNLIAYAIGTKEGASKNQFKQGPFTESIDTQFTIGDVGDYAFELRMNKAPICIKKWNEEEDRWIEFKKEKKRKIKRKRKEKKRNKTNWYIIGTKKQAALGFRGCIKSELPPIELNGKKGQIIWACSSNWKTSFPEFVWYNGTWEPPNPEQIQKIQKIVNKLKIKIK